MRIPYAKYQALGNSFIVLDEIQAQSKLKRFEKLAAAMCDPVYGIGADGLMVAGRKNKSFRVDIYNSDGSWAEKSGNGSRVAAMHLLQKGMFSGKNIDLETGSGISTITFHSGNKRKRIISASLGSPVFDTELIPVAVDMKHFINQPIDCGDRTYIASAVSVGNPHLILFCTDFDFDWETDGEILENHQLFPHRINVGFVVVKNDNNIEVRDWERGVGPTASSGTGAAAALVITVMRGYTSRKVNVHSPAGVHHVTWDDKSDQIILKGPVEFICSGEYIRP
jgi:diaminopimelate epimerase